MAKSMWEKIASFIIEHYDEKDLFTKLISVKGLGPKTAMGILRASTYDAIITAIEQQDVAFIKSMPGIGAKTASQIILDLKGKLVQSETVSASKSSKEMEDALEALKALGYKQSECTQVLKHFASFPNKSITFASESTVTVCRWCRYGTRGKSGQHRVPHF